MAEECGICKSYIFGSVVFVTKDGTTICPLCALNVSPEQWKEEKTREYLKSLKACIEYRKALDLPEHHNVANMQCGDSMFCFEKCPIPEERDKKKKIEDIVMVESKKKPKRTKKPEKIDVEDFLLLQARVLQKLAWNPEIYRLLDELSASEILRILENK